MRQTKISERTKTVIISVVTTLLVLFVIHALGGITKHGGKMNHSMMSGESMSMEQMMHDMNASLRGKTGDEFDKVFLEEMIVHHEGAVEMAELALDSTTDPDVLRLSREIIEAQETEISLMKQWLAERF